MRCSWLHCEGVFEGTLPSGWKLVARHSTTGEQVVVCPEHYPELLAADLRALLKLSEVPSLVPEGEAGPEDETKRLLKGRIPG